VSYYQNWPTSIAAVAQDLDSPDEHGAWETGIVSDRKHRGTAINAELIDHSPSQTLAVVQIRQCVFHPKRYNRVRKNYFLIGRNETGTAFAHAVPAGVARSSMAATPVEKAQAWIWGCTVHQLRRIVRHGDVCLFPLPKKFDPAATEYLLISADDYEHFVVSDSHVVNGTQVWVRAGSYIVLNPRLTHLKDQHPTVEGLGWYEIRIGRRASLWSFALESHD